MIILDPSEVRSAERKDGEQSERPCVAKKAVTFWSLLFWYRKDLKPKRVKDKKRNFSASAIVWECSVRRKNTNLLK